VIGQGARDEIIACGIQLSQFSYIFTFYAHKTPAFKECHYKKINKVLIES